MKDVTPFLAERIKQGVTTLASCLEIVRKDNQSYRFTTHDEPLLVANALYVPYASFTRTSISTSLDLDVDETEIRGILNSKFIARDDVAGGEFDFADVRLFLVDYENPDRGSITMRTGTLGEVTMNEDQTYVAEIRGLSQVYAYRIGEAYTPECRADLGDRRCKLPLNPMPWKAGTAYRKGDAVVGAINAARSYRNLSFVNPGFDADGYIDLARNITGWKTYGDPRGRWTVRSDPFYNTGGHSNYAVFNTDDANEDGTDGKHTVTDLGMFQDIDLIAQGIDPYFLDTGLCRLHASAWTACVNGREGKTRVRIFALDEFGVQISPAALFDTGLQKTKEDVWFETVVNDLLLPPGTRTLRFDLFAHKRYKHEEGAAFDSISAAVNYPDGTFGSADQYGDVAFVAQNAGLSGQTEPEWGNLLGTTYTDNGIVWKAVKSWKKVAFVDHVESGGRTIVPSYVFDNDGYYDGGLLRWETGKNAGRAQEIKTWKAGKLKLFQRPFHVPRPEDRFVLYPGCDKRRVTCSEVFANILNFRGEPDVPGQDAYYSTPDAPAE